MRRNVRYPELKKDVRPVRYAFCLAVTSQLHQRKEMSSSKGSARESRPTPYNYYALAVGGEHREHYMFRAVCHRFMYDARMERKGILQRGDYDQHHS